MKPSLALMQHALSAGILSEKLQWGGGAFTRIPWQGAPSVTSGDTTQGQS